MTLIGFFFISGWITTVIASIAWARAANENIKLISHVTLLKESLKYVTSDDEEKRDLLRSITGIDLNEPGEDVNK